MTTHPTVNTSNEEAAQVAGIVLIVLNVVTVAARFYARWFTKAGWKWDDWTILIALGAGILPGALSMWASSISPTGPAAASNLDPNYQFTESDILYTKITFSTSVLYFLCTCITKVSLLLLLYRLFAVSRNFRLWIYGALAIVVAFWFSATIADCLNCVPLEWTWRNGHADPRYCINFNNFWLGTGISESVIDLGILLLPVGMVWKLQLDRSKKWSVAGLFLLGGFVLFSGIAKVVLSYLPDSREPDFSAGALWTTVHLYTGIICANLPPCWPLFNKIARVSTGSWVRLSSLGKRWYSLGSSGQRSSKNRSTTMTQTEDKSRSHYNNLSDVEVGRPDYELAMYGRDGQVPDDRAKLNASHVQVNRPQW